MQNHAGSEIRNLEFREWYPYENAELGALNLDRGFQGVILGKEFRIQAVKP